MNCLPSFYSPQLELLHRGKVRESFRIDDRSRMIVVTDRLSAFDRVLSSPIPGKGAVLNSLSNFWFERTGKIIGNHLVSQVDPNITVVREAQPIRVEMVVRGYLTGSMWRRYRKGKRNFCGLKIPNGLSMNDRFPAPIITPTTKGDTDEDVSPSEIFERDLASREVFQRLERASLRLFKDGTNFLEKRGLLLVDTKYEFGLVDGEVVLIDEIHTPDSSRFWFQDQYESNPETVEQLDKEFVRQWLLTRQAAGQPRPDTLPQHVVEETSRRYLRLYELVTGHAVAMPEENVRTRICRSLVAEGLIKDGFVVLVMGSPRDQEYAAKIRAELEGYGIMAQMRVASAHKTPVEVARLAAQLSQSIEPGAVIAIAGLSNGLGGALAANTSLPVFNCPPFADLADLTVNLNSSLMMPSGTPAATVLRPGNAAQAALRSLNLQRLRDRFALEMEETRADLATADRELSRNTDGQGE